MNRIYDTFNFAKLRTIHLLLVVSRFHCFIVSYLSECWCVDFETYSLPNSCHFKDSKTGSTFVWRRSNVLMFWENLPVFSFKHGCIPLQISHSNLAVYDYLVLACRFWKIGVKQIQCFRDIFFSWGGKNLNTYPLPSMYGIFTYIYHKKLTKRR